MHVLSYSVLGLPVRSNVIPTSLILFTLIMVAMLSPETLLPTRAIYSHISENGILHSQRRENPNLNVISYCIKFVFHINSADTSAVCHTNNVI
jgi:hypothetical protein